ncbi:MAG: hypothetical protein KAR25_00910 [Methanosarcinales archaeon]|nr:hypothetical protein [Methanosarcinales archaeon]
MTDTLPTQVSLWKFNESADGVAYNSADGNNGGWHHVVATKSGTALPKLYVTGALQAGSCTYSATGCGYECAMIADSNRAYIGSGIDGGSSLSWFFNGNINKVAIYNVVLTADGVLTRYNDNKPWLGGSGC